MHGVVVTSRRAPQLKVLQRVPMEDGCQCGLNQLRRVRASIAREPSESGCFPSQLTNYFRYGP